MAARTVKEIPVQTPNSVKTAFATPHPNTGAATDSPRGATTRPMAAKPSQTKDAENNPANWGRPP